MRSGISFFLPPMARLAFSSLLLILLVVCLTCNSVDPPPPQNGETPTLELTLEDASCIEAWIQLTTNNLQLPVLIILIQNDQETDTINLVRSDTLLYIDSLLPNTNYTFQTTIQSSNHTSNELNVTTMDTTSHEFTFQSWTFGTIGSSTLYDVAIINENNIWAVGDIKIADTSQNGYTMYNAVQWNGSQWELMRIPFLFQGDSFYNPIYAVFAFSEDDIWFGIGNLIHWDGTKYWSIGISSVFPSLVNKIWGSSSNNLYVVGNNGNIAFFNGTQWSRIESGTEENLGDIFGITYNDGDYQKYIAAVDAMLILDEVNNPQRIDTEGGHTLSSVWGRSMRLIYTAGGSGLSLYKNYKWENENRPDVNTIYYVRGEEHNDVFGLSSTLLILHFNGFSWKFINTGANNIYYRLEVKNNLIVSVGWQGDKAVTTAIERN